MKRADRRAKRLRAIGVNAVAVVDGQTILPAAAALADELGVRYWLKSSTAA